jgi:arabinogalactan endo-1,4-beta-galactosidase
MYSSRCCLHEEIKNIVTLFNTVYQFKKHSTSLNFSNMKIQYRFSYILLLSSFLIQCSKSQDAPQLQPPTKIEPFAKGADVSWLSEMESSGIKFADNSGTQKDCMVILKEKGINTIRLRAWVNPATGWNNTTDLVSKAKRAKLLGMKILVAFHYSDTWADPGSQTKPVAWENLSFDLLKTALFNYTKEVMETLKLNGVIPNWVQIGNETNNGMLWPDGKIAINNVNNFTNFSALINQGYNAVKAVSDTTKVIVHIANGYDNGLFRWMFDGLTSNATKFDIIGLSLYPSFANGGANNWSATNSQCLANMNDLIARYNKPVLIVEVGMPQNDATTAKLFLTDLIAKTKSIAGGKGMGVMYWEPQCFNNWKGYGLGAFDSNGRPTEAMDAFIDN